MFYIGVDLGQTRDHSAIAIVERKEVPGVGRSPERHVRSAWRVPLGTPYPKVIEVVRRTVQHPQLYRRCVLAVDATGVGAPVVEMMQQSGFGVNIWAVVISAGDTASKSGRIGGGPKWTLPKRDLVSGVQVLLERGELRIAKDMPERVTLCKELREMEMSETRSAKVRLGADGYGQHDDLVIALALACWRAGQKDIGGHEGPLF